MPHRHLFVTPLLPCLKSLRWPHDKSAELLSDDLGDLKQFAYSLHLRADWLEWSPLNTPYFRLTARTRLAATLAGAVEIPLTDAHHLYQFWHSRTAASLARMLEAAPGLAARLAKRPLCPTTNQ
jgi:hypothetical protein